MDLYSVIDRHAQKALQATAACFGAYLRHRDGGGHLCLEGYEHKLAASNLVLAQQLSSKLFGRVYSCGWHWQVPVDLGERSMRIRLSYLGWRLENRRAAFVGDGCPQPILDALNAHDELLSLCVAMDLAGITIRYHPQSKRCDLSLQPNYGYFIWLLIPPVKYVRQPTPTEVDSTVLIIDELSRLFRSCARAVG